MPVPKFFIVPAALLGITAGYIAANPGGRPVRGVERASLSRTVETTPEATSTPQRALPPGLSGTLTYRTFAPGGGRERVTMRFPANEELLRTTDDSATEDAYSADGLWHTHLDCRNPTGCVYSLMSADGRVEPFDGELRWAPQGHRYVVRTYAQGGAGADDLAIINPQSGARQSLNASLAAREGNGAHIYGFAWDASGEIIAVTADSVGWNLSRFGLDGARTVLTSIRALPQYLYRSPDGARLAFTASGDAGWHMMLFDTTTNVVTDLGAMGSDGPDGLPVTVGPDQKGPMYIAWSPDGTTIAFGGGFEPPYVMHIVDLASGRVLTTTFPDGYPGEIKWSPGGALLAVSTYNEPRTHHESWVVDPKTGTAQDVLSGCVIIWSPDGKFLAIHGEREPGVAIVDIETLQHVQLSHTVGDTPISWTP